MFNSAGDVGYSEVGPVVVGDTGRERRPADELSRDLGTGAGVGVAPNIVGPDGGDPRKHAVADAPTRVPEVVSGLLDRAATVEALMAINERCKDAQVRLAIEYMGWTTPSDPQSAAEIATEVGCGVVADLLHHTRVGAGPQELGALAASGTLAWVQLCDAPTEAPPDLIGEARHHRLVPGNGNLPVAALKAAVPPGLPISIEAQSDELLRVSPSHRARILFDAAFNLPSAPAQ